MVNLNFSLPKGKSEQFIHKKLGIALYFCSLLHSFPYIWNFQTREIELMKPLRQFFYFLNCLVDITHRSCRSLIFFWCLYNNNLKISQIAFGFGLFLTVPATYVLQGNTMVKYKSLLNWTNALMKLGLRLEGITQETNVYKDPLEKLSYLPFLCMSPQGLIAMIGFVLFPKSLTMFHPMIDLNNPWQFWGCAFAESLSLINCWSVALFYILFYLWVHSFGICWTKLLCRRLERVRSIKNHTMDLRKELHVYRTILFANQGFNHDYYGRFVVPTVYTSTLFIIVLCIVSILRLATVMQFSLIFIISQVSIILIVFNGLSLHLNAWVYVHSQNFIITGKKLFSPSSLVGKEFNSLRPARVMVGSFFIEMSTVLSYFNGVIDQTISILLMT